uniref:Uncharacterized protein n=1 Tax=Schistosoma haematobium TaxID=6185 RepID=A0A095AM14_SCHHA
MLSNNYSPIFSFIGVDKLLDCVEQRSTDYDCPIYFVRDDYLARKTIVLCRLSS